MANVDAFAIQRSDLNRFLFADVGVEANGMTLSVLSALARLGVDPWDEAGRLAHQPRSKAIEGLAKMIASLPASLWSLPDSTPIATRLVALLPSRGSVSAVTRPSLAVGPTTLARKAMDLLPARSAASQRRTLFAPSAMVLVVLAALLAGLSALLIGQRAIADHDSGAATMEAPAGHGRPASVPGGIDKGA